MKPMVFPHLFTQLARSKKGPMIMSYLHSCSVTIVPLTHTPLGRSSEQKGSLSGVESIVTNSEEKNSKII